MRSFLASPGHRKDRTLLFDDYAVKFSRSLDEIASEADTQVFVYRKLKDVSGSPSVPKVLAVFSSDDIHYLVSERVHCPTVKEWIKDTEDETVAHSRYEAACQEVAHALRFLFEIPLPSDTVIGSIATHPNIEAHGLVLLHQRRLVLGGHTRKYAPSREDLHNTKVKGALPACLPQPMTYL